MKTMIVTGASSGIGRALALRASNAGFATVLVARNAGALETLASRIHAGGGLCATLALDVRDSGAASAIVSTAVQRYGRIDVLVNNAGIAGSGNLLQQSDEELQAQWETHVLAPLRLARWALPEVLKTGGQLFFFGSGVARVPTPGLGAYPPAKAAVRALTTQLRRELRGSGVAVTYVDPGAVDTPFMERAGMQGPPKGLTISPQTVADRIVRATTTRPRAVNASRWQTTAVAFGELLPALTDAILATFPQLAGAERVTPPVMLSLSKHEHEEPQSVTVSPPSVMLSLSKHDHDQPTLPVPVETPIETAKEWHVEESAFDRALAPLTRRMERVKLPREFIARLLTPGAALELGDVAMRWAGMPNKNERAAVSEVFQALTAAEFLRQTGDETWTVVRTP